MKWVADLAVRAGGEMGGQGAVPWGLVGAVPWAMCGFHDTFDTFGSSFSTRILLEEPPIPPDLDATFLHRIGFCYMGPP